ncbi:MAG: VOC family protein [Candidatus Zixiibacteriota bacterium]
MRIIELHIEVSDLERSLAFYQQILPHAKVTRWDDGSALALVLNDGSAFGLWQKGKQGVFAGRAAEHLHFALQVSDTEFQETKTRLISLGVEIQERTWKGGQRSVYFTDPDGHQGEFITCDWNELTS